MTSAIPESRRQGRTSIRCEVSLDWSAESGTPREDTGYTIDFSANGMALESFEMLAKESRIVVRSSALRAAFLSTVRYCNRHVNGYRVGVEFAARMSSGSGADELETDLYGLMRLNRDADSENIERVYKVLARRYHPDNSETGDAEAFLCVSEAFRILSNPARRRQYDRLLSETRTKPLGILNKRELFNGITGEQNRRFAILCLLYRQRMTDFQSMGLTRLDIDQMTGCTMEETGFSLWFLIEKGFVQRNNDSCFSISAAGVEHVERHREQHSEPVRLIESGTVRQARPDSTAIPATA